MKEANKRYKIYLDAIYDDCQRHGQITNLEDYSKVYGTNKNVGIILTNLGVLKRIERGVYSWNRRKPDQAMVIQVRDGLSEYYKIHKHSTNKTKTAVSENQPASVSNKVSNMNLDDFIDAFSMLPDTMLREEKKKLAKNLVHWKNS